MVFAELLAERTEINREFVDAGLPAPDWQEEGIPDIVLTEPAATPWGEQEDGVHRVWLARVANQFVNSFRPRLQRLTGSGSAAS